MKRLKIKIKNLYYDLFIFVLNNQKFVFLLLTCMFNFYYIYSVVLCKIQNDSKFEKYFFFQNSIGSVPSPFDCYLVNRSLKTLKLRMEQVHIHSFIYLQINSYVVVLFIRIHRVHKIDNLKFSK
jgi:hypothetical protein